MKDASRSRPHGQEMWSCIHLEVLGHVALEFGFWMLWFQRLDMPFFLMPNTSSTFDIVTSPADAML